MKYLVLLSLSLFSTTACADPIAQGHDQGNGGDACEARFIEVRDDISSWIKQGGGAGLQLPANLSSANYSNQMLAQMNSSISCVDDALTIDGAEKTCINISAMGSSGRITCNTKRFLETAQATQYMLVHHEYAGLAGLEVNDGSESNYGISSQITGFLADQIVKKLVVKPQSGNRYEKSFLNEDGSVTLQKPFFVFKGTKIPFVGELRRKGDTVKNSFLGVCRYLGFSQYMNDSRRVWAIYTDTDAVMFNDDGSIHGIGRYTNRYSGFADNIDFMLTEITCK